MANKVLEFFRAEEPGFAEVDDRTLTGFIAAEYPEFLQEPAFAKRHDLYSQQATARQSGESGGAMALAGRLGTGIERGLQTPERMIRNGLDALGWYGGLDKVLGTGTQFQDYNQSWLKSMEEQDSLNRAQDNAIAPTTFAGQLVEGVGKGVAELPFQVLPASRAATTAQAVKASAAIAGTQSGLETYGDRRQQGEGRLPAAIRGAEAAMITGLTTKAFGASGVESIFRQEGVKGIGKRIGNVLKQAGMEGAEEMADELQQDLLRRYHDNPAAPIQDTLEQLLLAGSIGATIGGMITAITPNGLPKPPPETATNPEPESPQVDLPSAIEAARQKARENMAPPPIPTVNDGGLAEPITGDFIEGGEPVAPEPELVAPVPEPVAPPAPAAPKPAPLEPVGDPGGNTFPLPASALATLDQVPVAGPSPKWAEKSPEPPPIYTVKGDEGMVAEVRPRNDGQYAVAVYDAEADGYLESLAIYPTLEAAKQKAETIRFAPQTITGSNAQAMGAEMPVPPPSPEAGGVSNSEASESEVPAPQPATAPEATEVPSTRPEAETAKMAPPAPPRKPRRVRREIIGDVLDAVELQGRMMSASRARATKSAEWWKRNKSLYNDAPTLPGAHNFIYGGNLTPDQVLKNLQLDAPGTYGYWETNDLWAAIAGASKARKNMTQMRAREEKFAREDARQALAFDKATKTGEIGVRAGDLAVGDVLDVEGETLRVTDVDADTGDVLLEDGSRFGRQRVSESEVLYVEQLDKAEASTDFLGEEDAAPEIPQPKPEPFKLETLDDNALQAQKDKEAAQADRRRQQGDLNERRNQRLIGSTGDLGQGDLLREPTDLLAPPSPGRGVKGFAMPKQDGFEPPPEKIRPPGAPPLPADDPKFSAMPLGLPELVGLAKALGKGKYPKLRKSLGKALGHFRSMAGAKESGEIALRRDLFKLISDQERSRLLDQADDYALAMVPINEGLDQEASEREARERADVSRLYFEHKLAELTAERLQQEPVRATKVLAHEIGHWIDFLPDAMIAGRGNLFGRIASLKSYLRQTLPKDPSLAGEDFLTPEDRRRLRRQAEANLAPRPPKDSSWLDAWREDVKKEYQELVEVEIEERGLMKLADIKAELEPLIAWHLGTDEIPKYFTSSEEMYAEAFSVFLVNPSAMAKRAPNYFKAINEYMIRKPEVARLYDQIQNDIKSGAHLQERAKSLYESFDRDTAQFHRRTLQGAKQTAKSWVDNIIYHFDRRFGPVYRVARSYAKEGAVKEAIGSFLYRGAEHELFLGRTNRDIGQWLVDHNLDWKDFGAYLFHTRVVEHEHDKANPLGFSPNSSREAIGELGRALGPERLQALEVARKRFRAIYADQVLPLLRQSGLVNAEQAKFLEDQIYYATFKAVRGEPETEIDALLDRQYGNGVGSQIYRRVGNIGDVANPATSTVMKALSLISAAYRNNAKAHVVRMLLEQEPEFIREADQRWTGKRREPVIKGGTGEAVQTIVVMVDGQPKAYYVRGYMAEAFNHGNPIENNLVMAWLKASRGVKSLFTQWNPAFWAVNYVRDAYGFWNQMPGAKTSDYLKLLPRAMRAARASLSHAKENKDAEAALRRKLLIAQSDPRGIKGDVADEYEFTLAAFGMNPAAWDKSGPKAHSVVKAWNWFREQGQSLERVHKIMGMLHLDEKHPNMPEWQKRELVRERAGSPDFMQRPASKAMMDSLWLFFNPWKEGSRSFAKAAMSNPLEFGAKLGMGMAVPTIMQALAESGMLGDEIKRMMESISDYDATNYLVMPLGWDDEEKRKVRYLRLPLWEPARIAHGLLFKSMTGRGEGLASYAGGQVPGFNPLSTVAVAWMTFLTGGNPYDSFYGRELLDADKFSAESGDLWVDMLKYTANELGGGIAYRFRDSNIKAPDPTPLENLLQNTPFVGPAVGRFIRVSNRGVIERDKKEIFEPEAKARAAVRLAMEEIMRKQLANEALTPAERKLILTDTYAQDHMLRVLPEAMKSRGSFLLDRLNRAPTKEARMKLLLKILSETAPPQPTPNPQ